MMTFSEVRNAELEGGGHALPHHLEQESHSQYQPGHTAQQGIPCRNGAHLLTEDDPHHQRSDKKAQCHDQPGAEVGIDCHLGHRESQAPDQCHRCQHQIRNQRNLIFLHRRPPYNSKLLHTGSKKPPGLYTDGKEASHGWVISPCNPILSKGLVFHNPLYHHNSLCSKRNYSPFLVVFLPIVACKTPGPNR